VREAVELVDTEGLDGLSMSRLASRLGFGTMSLYRYVPGKDQLISLMLDHAIGEPPEPAPGEQWRSTIERWARANRDVFLRHPWILPLATRPRLMGPQETAWLEAALLAVSGIGLSPAEMFDAVMLINGYVRGVAQSSVDTTQQGPGEAPDSAEARLIFDQQDRYPTLAVVMSSGVFDGNCESDDGFEFGLQRILDGIERFVDQLS
jgi:AcrR family transcriptional regulator